MSGQVLERPAPLDQTITAGRVATGRVMAVQGERSLIEVDGQLYQCILSGRLKHARKESLERPVRPGGWERNTRDVRSRWYRSREQAPLPSPIAVGDHVQVRLVDDKEGMILERLERKSWLGRLRPTKGPQVIAANVDVALVTTSVAEPFPDYFLLDQLLVQAQAGAIEPWIVFNKCDLLSMLDRLSMEDAEERRHSIRQYRELGYRVFCTSAETGEGIGELENALGGKTAALAGESGVGKSSLVNLLIPQADAEIGEISEWSGRGMHTTSCVAMYPLPSGGYLVDAPGIRSLALWQVKTGEIPFLFPEIGRLSPECAFQPCAHLADEDCAVRAAAESGQISPRRYQHYRRLREETSS